MLIFFSIILTFCYCCGAYVGRRDVFSPRFVFNVFSWLKNVPGILCCEEVISEELLLSYFLFKFVAFVFVNLGITWYETSRRYKIHYYYAEKRHTSRYGYLYPAAIMFVIGLVMKMNIISSSGGLLYIVTHIQSRKEILSGHQYAQVISSTLLVCSVLFFQYAGIKNGMKLSKMSFVVIFSISLLLSMVFGARKPAIMLVLAVLMLRHFLKKRFTVRNFFSVKTLCMAFVIVMFMVMMPMLRLSSETDLVLNPLEWAGYAIGKLDSVLGEFSYYKGDLFVFDYFSSHPLWWGKSYLNILVQWIPSSIYVDKPPMDDGMYLWNMMNGFAITPTTPTNQLFLDSSIPFTLEGALYSNFGVCGIILGAFLVGCIYQKTYHVMVDTGFPIVMILIYQQVIFTFVPSVLHITSVILNCILFIMVIKISRGYRIVKKCLI